MNLEDIRAQQEQKRAIAPTLYRNNAIDTTTYPGSIEPPAWLCTKHSASWRKWADYRPYTPIVLLTVGTPLPPEEKRRAAIAEQREVIAAICHQRCKGDA